MVMAAKSQILFKYISGKNTIIFLTFASLQTFKRKETTKNRIKYG